MLQSGQVRALPCPACGSITSHAHLYRKNGCEILRCAECGLGRAEACDFDPANYYTHDYFSGGHADGYANYLGAEPVLRREFAGTVRFIRKHCDGGRLLELGCAYGFFLQEAKPHFDVAGIELAEDAAAHCRRNGLRVLTGRPDDVERLAGISFGITAPDPLRPVAEALVVEMGGEPVFIAEEDRDLYHAALASAANHLVTLVVQASDLLREAGVGQPARMLGPLLSAALDNALRLGDAALTGPVARGDADTVASHVAALRAAAPEALPAYLALARLTADRALSAGTLSAPDAQRLLGVLGGAPR